MSKTVLVAVRRWVGAGMVGAAALLGTGAAAQADDDYPNRALRIIVLFPAGNGIDTSARSFSELFSKELGQPVVVENRPGGNGIVALQAVKSAPADGYTLLVSSSSPTTIATAFGKTLPYDPFTDFQPVAGFIRSVGIFTVPVGSQVSSMREWAEAAKARAHPTTVGTYADAYNLTSQQLARMAGIRLQNVPYKGQGMLLQDLVGERVDMAYGDTQSPQELVRAGKIRALAVTGRSRHVAYPDVPTVAESGFPDFSYYSWNAFFVRAGTPAPVVEKLGAAIRRVLDTAEFRDYVNARGSEPLLDDVAQIQRMMQEEVQLYRSLIASTTAAEP